MKCECGGELKVDEAIEDNGFGAVRFVECHNCGKDYDAVELLKLAELRVAELEAENAELSKAWDLCEKERKGFETYIERIKGILKDTQWKIDNGDNVEITLQQSFVSILALISGQGEGGREMNYFDMWVCALIGFLGGICVGFVLHEIIYLTKPKG